MFEINDDYGKTNATKVLHKKMELDTFGQNYPEKYDCKLDCNNHAIVCSFNTTGTLLAVGCNNGRISIWDFNTRTLCKIIEAHVYPVSSLEWSIYGDKLLSGSTDNTVFIWDVVKCTYVDKYRFPSALLKVQFHPTNDQRFLVILLKHAPVMIDVGQQHHVLITDDTNDLSLVASFNRSGDFVLVGNSKGNVYILEATTFTIKASFRITVGMHSTAAAKGIVFAPHGDYFLIYSADRVIRVYDFKDIISSGINGQPNPLQRLQDVVNKTKWRKCVFSGDGEYICGASARRHALYIWEISSASLMIILQYFKQEVMLDVMWHPLRPVIVSISSGVVSVWIPNPTQSWPMLAPDMKELDENIHYEERESEFDISDEDTSEKAASEDEENDLDVDVERFGPTSCDKSAKRLEVLPIPVIIDGYEETEITPSVAKPVVVPTPEVTRVVPQVRKQRKIKNLPAFMFNSFK